MSNCEQLYEEFQAAEAAMKDAAAARTIAREREQEANDALDAAAQAARDAEAAATQAASTAQQAYTKYSNCVADG